MKTMLVSLISLVLLLLAISGCDGAALAPACPEHTDFALCYDAASGKPNGNATCYEAPAADVVPTKVVPVVGCAMPEYNVAECVDACR